ncbi:MAG: histidine--tRNA ligase [Legionellales bacterium]|jgi:histidyl-tRNA synthetase
MIQIQAIRGMHDIMPAQIGDWQYIENIVRRLTAAYGYQEIRFPVLEMTALFKRTVGEESDIVTKEMYTFSDRSDESVTLRPEGTVGCVRAALEQGILFKQSQRLWYMGPMFRYERPQKGRLRQFHQFGLEAFGMPGPDIDAEIIALTARLWEILGVRDRVYLEINSLGTSSARAAHREALVTYFKQHADVLDEDSQRRLVTNPLRILDSKNPAMRTMLDAAPALLDYLDEESALHFKQLQAMLDEMGITYKVNPRLVRGLDYYTKTVFEWMTHDLGAQGTICAGGRYDGLVEQLGGEATPAIGFALGLERLIDLVHLVQKPQTPLAPHAYFVLLGESTVQSALVMAERLRDRLPSLRLLTNTGSGSAKSQFKRADKSGAQFALILGDDEMQANVIAVKDLRGDFSAKFSWDELINFLGGICERDRNG